MVSNVMEENVQKLSVLSQGCLSFQFIVCVHIIILYILLSKRQRVFVPNFRELFPFLQLWQFDKNIEPNWFILVEIQSENQKTKTGRGKLAICVSRSSHINESQKNIFKNFTFLTPTSLKLNN